MPRDLAQRIAWFYCTSSLSGAFSGLLAAAIARMHGVGGLEGWRWIFILEGLATVLLGIATFSLQIGSPALGGKWLEPDEIRFLELQLFIKQGGRFQDEGGESRLEYILMCQSATSYGTKFTLPTVTKSMGFSTTNAQLMTVPPYAAGALSALFFSRLSDRFYWRMPFVAIPMVFITAGYAVVLSLDGDLGGPNVGAAFTGMTLTTIGIHPIAPAGSSWAANKLAPASPSTSALAFGCSGLLVALLLELSYKWGNKRKEAWTEADAHARYSEDELIKLGGKSPLFRYTL
ncbi:hypothetical protein RB594_003781 [Gaeumannomyces avenae]